MNIDAPTPEHKKIYNALSAYCKEFPNVKNFVFSGGTGTGKTFVTQIIANMLYDQNIKIHYTTAFAMVTAFQKYVQSFGQDSSDLYTFLECELLIIDDLGSEPTIKNITQEHIYNIINERLLHNRPFIISTNLSPADLIERYDQRIASRILNTKNSALIEFKSQDLRI